jgi:hypothetical protein
MVDVQPRPGKVAAAACAPRSLISARCYALATRTSFLADGAAEFP